MTMPMNRRHHWYSVAYSDQANVTIDVSLLHADWANTDNARYAEYEELDDEDNAPEHIGYRFNTVPDTLEVDDILIISTMQLCHQEVR